MFNATLAGHHLRTDYNGSRGGSRAGSRYDLNEVGRHQVNHSSVNKDLDNLEPVLI